MQYTEEAKNLKTILKSGEAIRRKKERSFNLLWRWHSDSQESINEVKNQYNQVSYIFDRFPIAAAEDVTYIINGIPNNARINALDIGSGTGRSVSLLCEKFDKVIGIDLSPEMVDYATNRCASKANVAFLARVSGLVNIESVSCS